jgi:hypothetical protein
VLVVILCFSKQIQKVCMAKSDFGASNCRISKYECGHNFLFCRPVYKTLHNRIPEKATLSDCYRFRCLLDLQLTWTTVSVLILGQLHNVCISWAGSIFPVTSDIKSISHVAFKWLSTVYYDLMHLNLLTPFLLRQLSPACTVTVIALWPRICIVHRDSENYFCVEICKGPSNWTMLL